MILLITGPPGSGKTTEADAWARAAARGVHIPVDDVRLWVKGGLAESVPWTEETELQFQAAEAAAWIAARAYCERGFDVVIDHCRNLSRLGDLCLEHWAGLDVRRLLLLPPLEVNLIRNRERTNKDFDPLILEETICAVHERMSEEDQSEWALGPSDASPGWAARDPRFKPA
jgi:tRNA uridine 5-carbamoylmethylation protein Kti12